MPNPFFEVSGKSEILTGDLASLGGSFIPDNFPHREIQIEKIVSILGSIMRNTRPSNIIIYGKTGSGKTSTTRYVSKMLAEAANSNVQVVYVNCQIFDSPYSILVEMANSLSKLDEDNIPELGLPLDRIYNELMKRVNANNKFLLVVLDEIDKLVLKNGGDALYAILKTTDDTYGGKTSIIGITNDTGFQESLDARVKSRLNQESILFPPYNASELKDILKYRAQGIVKDSAIEDSAINLCAAIGAQEHGDARKAIDLLRISIEVAIRNRKNIVTDTEVYSARDKFEMDVLKEAVTTLPLQSKLVLLSAVVTQEIDSSLMVTGELYENYRNICVELGFQALTPRRISDITSELEDFGLISSSVKSMGRYGRTKIIQVMGSLESVKKYLLEDEDLSMFRGVKVTKQYRFDTDLKDQQKLKPDDLMKKLDDMKESVPDDGQS
ncbi:MAG: cell division control protein Cdc6 [Thermoplasmatales archaeon B_DKE]|nr:MAG: cell division control protein Cdc6 [Thermoplasmatales archaeon B_DKE]